MKFVKTSHSVYRLQYHVVWVCKYRRRILNSGVRSYLCKLFPQLLRSMPGVKIESIGFDQDHLHMLIMIPPKYSIASVMVQLKSQSASELRRAFAWLKKVYWKENLVWSPGYFVSSVGVDEETIKKYVEHQGQQDSGGFRSAPDGAVTVRTPGLPGGIYVTTIQQFCSRIKVVFL